MLVLCISLVVTFLDQVTKYAVTCNVAFGDQIPLIPGLLNLTYVRNTGAAWGIFAGFSGMLIVLSFVMLSLLIFCRRHFMEDTLIHKISMGLIISGIVGNLIDRVRLEYVVDFIDFYWFLTDSHFPSFNVADSAICVGVGLYLISTIPRDKKEPDVVLAEVAG